MNFYPSYTDKSLIMRLIVDALYCKRKIMKKNLNQTRTRFVPQPRIEQGSANKTVQQYDEQCGLTLYKFSHMTQSKKFNFLEQFQFAISFETVQFYYDPN